MNFEVKKWIKKSTQNKKQEAHNNVYYISKNNLSKTLTQFKEILLPWQYQELSKTEKNFSIYHHQKGTLFFNILPPSNSKDLNFPFEEILAPSNYSLARDSVGQLVRSLKELSSKQIIHIHFEDLSTEQCEGILVGLELAGYQFRNVQNLPELCFFKDHKPLDLDSYKEALVRAHAVNIARNLVNLPPNELHPESFAHWLQNNWKKEKNWNVEVWNKERLKKEGFSLLTAVGNSAIYPPHLVRLSYRPHKKNKEEPLCFIGKGITFDSGGLDIKPASGMRLMKKDMGGAACLAGVAHFVKETAPDYACDFYFALAENAVDEKSFRPGDIIYAKNKMSIEISNTDAEGRLVLADALLCAQEQNPKIRYLIDVATLTGAGKIALGADVASLFSNYKNLAEKIEKAAQESGDYCWQMPLVNEYENMLQSPFADMMNASENGLAGSITAALFLRKFIHKNTAWAHFDIFAWQDGNKGAYLERGGSGQTVQCLIQFLKSI